MKNNILATVLIVALAVTGVWGLFLYLQYNRYTARANALQARVNEINNTRTIIQSLANDAVAYSQTHPALVPVLQQFGLTGAPAPAPAPAPVAAPAKAAPAKTAPKTSTTKK
jgi:hypothetical protein